MGSSKLHTAINVIQKGFGTVVVILLVFVTLAGLLAPQVDFQYPTKQEYIPGYAVMEDDLQPYVLPSTTGGFILDTPRGFVYIDTIGRYIPVGSEYHPGSNLYLIHVEDTVSSFDFEGLVQEKSRGYHIGLYLNVLIALIIIVFFEYYNLIVRVNSPKLEWFKNRLFREPINISSSLIVVVTAVFLILNINSNGILNFGQSALAEPAIFYMPYMESQGPAAVETSLGLVEFGRGYVKIEGTEINIIRSLLVYDGHIVRVINPVNPDDILIHSLIGLILVFTALYGVNKIATFNVARGSRRGVTK